MESDLIVRIQGELLVKKNVLIGLVSRSPQGSDALDAIGYLIDQPHTGNYVSVSKVSDLLRGAIGRDATSKLLHSMVCDEEDLPDIMLSNPGSVEASVAAQRLRMPESSKAPKPRKIPSALGPSSLAPSYLPPEVKMPARRAQALGKSLSPKRRFPI